MYPILLTIQSVIYPVTILNRNMILWPEDARISFQIIIYFNKKELPIIPAGRKMM